MADPTVTPMFGVPLDQARIPIDPMTELQARVNMKEAQSQSHRYVEKSGKHKGVAGVARDILGTLGDFLLTRLHMKPMYGPSQDQRKLEAAWQGHEDDPMAAIDRVTDVDFATGNKLRDQYIDNERQRALVDSTKETRDARVAIAQDAVNQKVRVYGASMLGTMANWDDTKKKQYYPQMRQQVITAGRKQGLDLSDELPEEYDPVQLDAFIDAAVPVGTQRAQRLTSTRDAHNYELGTARVKETTRHHKVDEQLGEERVDTTRRGQDIRSEDTRRGQDLNHTDKQAAETGKDKRAAARAKVKPSGDDIAYLRAHPEMRDRFDGRFGVGMAKRVLGQ